MFPRLLPLLCGAFALLCGALVPSVAHAVPTFPIREGFRNSTVGTEWHLNGSAALTAPTDGEGNGWLRLTGTVNNQVGVIVNDNAFDSDRGVLAEFEYATHSGTGADGLVFFLYDGSVPIGSFQRGPLGGSIGYTSCHAPETAGLTGAYIGVAFDEWGNFANGDFCAQNGGMPDGILRPGRVVIRGGVDSDYQYLTSQPVSQGLIAQFPDTF